MHKMGSIMLETRKTFNPEQPKNAKPDASSAAVKTLRADMKKVKD